MRIGILVSLAMAIAFSSPAWADGPGNAKAGETIFKKCKVCHTVQKDGKNKVGPNLFGVVGRTPGTAPKYKYSPSYMKAAENGLVWNEDTIFKYLANPKAFMREITQNKKARSKMVFRLKKEDQRRDVIAFLKTQM